MLKNLPSRTSQKFYPLFLIYSQIITYYSFIILLILKNNVQNEYKTIQNCAHNYPIILELFSLKLLPIILKIMPAH